MKVFIILDRSGSMSSRWAEVTAALQGWLDKLDPDDKVWGLAFDNQLEWFATKAKKVSFEGIGPRGMTALFDAIGCMAGVVDTEAKKKAQIVILTDGAENASQNKTRVEAGKIIEGWKEKGYDVVFLGADFDAFGQAANIGVAAAQTMSFDSANYAETSQVMSARSTRYKATGKVADFTDAERKKTV